MPARARNATHGRSVSGASSKEEDSKEPQPMMLLASLIALPLLSASPAPAGALDRTQVDAQAKWIAHFDVEAFRGTQLLVEAKAADKEGELEKGLAKIAAEHGIQVLDDVFSITAYGTVLGEDHGVAIVRANARAEAALAKAAEQAGAKPERVGERDFVRWGGDKDAAFSCLRPATGERREIVFAKSQADLAQALDVLEKKRPGLDSQPQSDLFAAPAAGTFAFVAASGILEELASPAGHDVQQLSAMARLAKGVRIELGENGGNLFVDLRLRTEKPEDAKRVQRIFDGLLALPGLLHADSEASDVVDRLTQAISVEAQNESAHLRFQYGTHALFGEIQTLQSLGLGQGGLEPLRALHSGGGHGHKPAEKPEEKPK